MSEPAPLSIAILGVGLVGKELISQLQVYSHASKESGLPPVRIVAIANSKKYVTISSTFPDAWEDELVKSTTSLQLPAFVQDVAKLVKDGPVALIDNTASQDVADYYPSFLKAGMHIVTPNKKAFSGTQALYDEIVQAASSGPRRKLIYKEATVGASLPVISTLADLLVTGDEISKIEGVFSGTLSYIFNEFSSSGSEKTSTFSSIVKIAKDKGFTEPHPGDDLNGLDVARKLTILTRMIDPHGSKIKLQEGCLSVDTKSLVPDALTHVKDGQEFVKRLADFDHDFASLNEQARKQGNVVRYVGVLDLEKGSVKASLESVPFSHPFAASLGSSDNMFIFHTKRYSPRPLIVQGAGAGAACTAMGVLSDIIKLAGRVV